MEISQILELMKAVCDMDIAEFSYEEDGGSLRISRYPSGAVPPKGAGAANAVTGAGAAKVSGSASGEGVSEGVSSTAPGGANPDVSANMDGNIVKSPLVGTFYSAASPDDEALVQVGDRVSKGQVLGIVEAMKLMNEIESDYDGVVEAILVKNGDMVEFDQPMFVIT